jgi:DNA-binding response OmpR family regulator
VVVAAELALVVEDSLEFRNLCVRMLEKDGFKVDVCADGETAVVRTRELSPDLILLDVSLPGIDGFEVCKQVREFSDAYIIMVSGRDNEIDKVVGLTVGADDYVTKPFSPRELMARVTAMRRRPRREERVSEGLRDFGTLTIDIDSRETFLDGALLELTKVEFDILALLTSSPRRAFSRTLILDRVWGDWYGDDHIIDVHMTNLRKKLGDRTNAAKYIQTVRGVGYRFVPPA